MARELRDSGIQWFPIIPCSWKLGRIKNIIDVLTDYTANGSFGDLAKNVQYLDFEDYARLVRLTDLREDLENEGIYVSQDSYEYLSNSKLFGGEILIANVGAYAGLFCEMPEINRKATLGPNMFLIRTNQNMLQHYLLYLGNSKIVKEQLTQKAVSAAQPKLNKNDLRTVMIPIPCIEEQQKIADYLDIKCAEIDSLSSDIQSQINILEEYKKSVITEAVTKGLNLDVEMKDSGIEWIGNIPKEWGISKLRYFVKVRSEKGYYTQSDVYVGLENIESNTGKYIKTKTEYSNGIYDRFYAGDILFNKLRPYLAKTLMPDFDGFCTGELVIIKDVVGVKKFLYYFFFSEGYLEMVNNSTYGAKMPRASWEYIKNLEITIPSISEQEKIVAFLDEKCEDIDDAITKKEKQLEVLEEYKKSLIYEYVTGKKEVSASD